MQRQNKSPCQEKTVSKVDYSRVEAAVDARRGGCNCGFPPSQSTSQTRHNEADAVTWARPKGKKC